MKFGQGHRYQGHDHKNSGSGTNLKGGKTSNLGQGRPHRSDVARIGTGPRLKKNHGGTTKKRSQGPRYRVGWGRTPEAMLLCHPESDNQPKE